MIIYKANILLVVLSMGAGLLCAQTDLIISEYLENGGDKCIEIHNPTTNAISLLDYRISIWNDGSTMRQTLRNLSAAGDLAPGGTILSCRSGGAVASIPVTIDFATGFTGNDAVAITKGPTNEIVDLFGNIGCDPIVYSEGDNTSEDVILRRHTCVVTGVVSDPPGNCPFPTLATEWTSFPPSVTGDLGNHNAIAISILTVNGDSPMDCSGGLGSITVAAVGLTDGEDYLLNYTRNGAIIQDAISATEGSLLLSNLVAATYSDFSIEDLAGSCTSAVETASIEIISSEFPTNVFINAINPQSCGGDGTINANANGTNLEYSLDGGDWQADGTFLVPQGDYQITVRSSNAPLCVTDPESVSLTDPVAAMIVATPVHPVCGAEGSISLSGIVAGREYFVEWFDPVRVFINRLPTTGNELIIENLPAGNYTNIRVIDQTTFCESNTITGPIILDDAIGPTISVAGENPESCGANGTITISGLETGTLYDLSYDKDGSQILQDGLPASGGAIVLRTPTAFYSNFQVRETGSSCNSNIWSDTIEVMDQSGLRIAAVAENASACGENGTLTIFGLSPGTSYDITYSQDGDSVQQLNLPALGEQIELSLAAATYSNIQVSLNSATCPSNLLTENFIIKEPEAPVIEVSSRLPLKCGGDGTLIIQGLEVNHNYHLTYDYNSIPNVINSVTAGSDATIELVVPTGAYRNIQVTHENTGCLSNLLAGTTNVFDLDAPTVSVSGQNPMSCGASDGLLRILGLTSGTMYDLTYDSNGVIIQLTNVEADNSQIVLSVSAGTYTNVQVIDPQTECRSNLIFYEIILSAPGATIDIDGTDPTMCGGDGLLTVSGLDRNGIYDVTFDQNGLAQNQRISSQNLQLNFVVPAGNYTNVQVRETSTGCSSNLEMDVVTISNADELAPKIDQVIVSEQTSCGGSVDLEIDAGADNLQYSIDGGKIWSTSPMFFMLQPNNYEVAIQVEGSNNCVVKWDEINVPGGSVPTINAVETTPIEDCGGTGAIAIDAQGGDLRYSIDGGANWDTSNAFHDLVGNTYEVAVQESGSDLCVTQGEQVTLVDIPSPEINSVVQNPIETCNGTGSISINADGIQSGRNYRLDLDSAGNEMQINLVAQSNMMLLVTGLAGGLYHNLQLHDEITTCASNVVPEAIVASAVEATLLIDSVTNPTACGVPNGEIFLLVNEPATNYVVDVTINGVLQPSSSGISNADRIITIPDLSSGSYTIVVSLGDCVSSMQTTVLSAPEAPTVTLDQVDPPMSCGGNDGRIILATPQPATEYQLSFTWNGNPAPPLTLTSSDQNLIFVNSLSGGLYEDLTLAVNNCYSAPIDTFLAQPTLVPGLLIQPDNSCETDNGQIGLTGLEANSTYQLTFDSLGTLIDRPAIASSGRIFIRNLPAGIYRDIVLSKGSCQSDTIQMVEIDGQSGSANAMANPINPTSCEGMDGMIIFDSLEPFENVSANFLFEGVPIDISGEMTDAEGVFRITNLGAGRIEGLFLSFDGCSTEPIDLELRDPEIEDIEIEVINPISCTSANGAIIINNVLPGENYEVSYTFEGENNTLILPSIGVGELRLESLVQGFYSEIRLGLNNCISNTLSATLSAGAEVPTFSITDVSEPTSCNSTDGAFVLSGLEVNLTYDVSYDVGGVSSHAAPYSSGATGQIFLDGLGAGAYTDIIVSLEGCQSEPGDTMLVAAGELEVTLGQEDPSDCMRIDGAIIFSGLADGLFTITYDSNGVTTSIEEVPSNGLIRLENLGVGEYSSIRISDGICTSGVHSVVLEAVSGFAISQRGKTDPTTCGELDGSITITSVPTDTIYEVNFLKDGVALPPVILRAAESQLTIPNLGKGLYDQISIRLAGCESGSVGPVTLEDPPGPVLNHSFRNPRACDIDDGIIELMGLPGSSMFQLNYDTMGVSVSMDFTTDTFGTFALGNLGPGIYRGIEVVDQDMCVSDTFSIELEAPGEIEANVRVMNPQCSGELNGSASVQVMGSQEDLSFSWSHDPGEMDSIGINLPDGLHSVTISRPGSCTTINSFEVAALDTVGVTIEKTDEQGVGARDGTATAIATSNTGFFNLAWSNDATDEMLVDLAPGTYYVTVTNENGCQAIDSVDILPFDCPFLLFNITARQDVACSGDSTGRIVITPNDSVGTAPYTYQWEHDTSEQDSIVEGLSAGQYSLTITDATGCTGISPPLSIKDMHPPLMLELDTTRVSMPGAGDGMASIMASGGSAEYTYLWSTGETSEQILGLDEGMYSVVVSDDLGCSDSIVFTLSADVCLLEVDTNLVSTSCPGSNDARMELQVSGSDNAEITWSHNPNLVSPIADSLLPGEYTVIISEDANCSREIDFAVADPAPLEVTYAITKDLIDTSLFAIETIINGGRAPYLITWTTGEMGSSLTGVPEGEYSLVVVDGAGCIAIDSVLVETPRCALAIRETITDSGCDGVSGAIELDLIGASGGSIQIEWSDPLVPSELSIDGLSEGTYWVQINDAGCTTSDTFEVSLESAVEPIFRAGRDICEANSVFVFEFNGLASDAMPLSITLNNEEISAGFIDTLTAGNYQFSITDDRSCSFDSLIVVDEEAVGEYLVLPQDTQILLGHSVELIGGVNGDANAITPEWRVGDAVLCSGCWSIEVAPQETRNFEFAVIGDGCTVSEQVNVYVDRRDLFFVPNAFTLNGDGVNDQLIIHDGRGLIREVNFLKVYDRSGREVYLSENFPANVELDDFADSFDDFITPAVFIYVLEVELFDGEVQTLTGDFSLLR